MDYIFWTSMVVVPVTAVIYGSCMFLILWIHDNKIKNIRDRVKEHEVLTMEIDQHLTETMKEIALLAASHSNSLESTIHSLQTLNDGINSNHRRIINLEEQLGKHELEENPEHVLVDTSELDDHQIKPDNTKEE